MLATSSSAAIKVVIIARREDRRLARTLHPVVPKGLVIQGAPPSAKLFTSRLRAPHMAHTSPERLQRVVMPQAWSCDGIATIGRRAAGPCRVRSIRDCAMMAATHHAKVTLFSPFWPHEGCSTTHFHQTLPSYPMYTSPMSARHGSVHMSGNWRFFDE